jgi:hypothetical protein
MITVVVIVIVIVIVGIFLFVKSMFWAADVADEKERELFERDMMDKDQYRLEHEQEPKFEEL